MPISASTMRRRRGRSTAASGSSSSSTSGPEYSARAIATRWRSPPDERSDSPVHQRRQLQQLDEHAQIRTISLAHSVGDVLAHVEVRKEQDVLRYVAGAPMANGRVDVPLGIEEHVAVDAMRPRRGARRPAIASSADVFPDPDGPNNASARASTLTSNDSGEVALVQREVEIEGRH